MPAPASTETVTARSEPIIDCARLSQSFVQIRTDLNSVSVSRSAQLLLHRGNGHDALMCILKVPSGLL